MAKVKVVSLDGAKNQTVQYPVVGALEHDSNGVAEVEEEKVGELLLRRKDHLMLESDYKLMIADNHKQKQKKTLPPNHKKAFDLEEEEEANEEDEDKGKNSEVTEDQFRASISGETKLALQAMCEDSEYPAAEWKDLKKAELVEYLVSKTK